MSCDTWQRAYQTITQRKEEVTKAVEALSKGLGRGKIKAKVGPQGAIVFEGWTAEERGRVTDACAYRRIMATGSALARHEIAKAEKLAGRSVDRQIVGQGVHSHDAGATWNQKG